jgi:hypothetical protein
MPGELLEFPRTGQIKPPLGHFIRLGESGYRKLEHLQSAGRLPLVRAVGDASRFMHQRELVNALRAAGAEIVLDTKAAELAAPLKAAGFAKGAPWSELASNGLVGPDVFAPGHRGDIFGAIARFAIQHRVDAVLAPGHSSTTLGSVHGSGSTVAPATNSGRLWIGREGRQLRSTIY